MKKPLVIFMAMFLLIALMELLVDILPGIKNHNLKYYILGKLFSQDILNNFFKKELIRKNIKARIITILKIPILILLCCLYTFISPFNIYLQQKNYYYYLNHILRLLNIINIMEFYKKNQNYQFQR